jgi:uncharacterized protein YkwD
MVGPQYTLSRAPRLRSLLCCALLLMPLGSACVRAQRQPASGVQAAPLALTQASHYDTRPEPDFARGDAVSEELEQALVRLARERDLTLDGRLAELSLGIALGSEGAARPPSYPLVSYHAHRAGIAEPTPQVWLASGADLAQLLPALEQAVHDATASSRLTHLGVAAIALDSAAGTGVVIAVALSSRTLSLREPVARSVPVGTKLHLAGELARGHTDPILVVTSEAGITRRPLGKGRSFAHDVSSPPAGALTLELLATGPEGLTVVALMPVMVGAPVASQPPSAVSAEVEASAEEVAHKLSTLIADEREKRKLPPLRSDVRLEDIALAHSEDMLAHGFIAHTSKRSGDASQRVQSAGLDALLVLENIGRGYSASELHHGLMESPGHRANILHPDARELGIGVVSQREGERAAFLVTELFTQLADQ